MTINEEYWHSKIFKKKSAVNFRSAKFRYILLKKNALNLYPTLCLFENKDHWTVKQKLVEKKNHLFFTKTQLKKIAKKIDDISKLKIFHGDLCFSNISFCTQGKVLLFDWEIILEVLNKDKLILRTTPYCLHPRDKIANRLTILSDRFAIAALTMISCHHPSWRFYLSNNHNSRLRLANYIDSFSNKSSLELVDNIINKINKGVDHFIFD